MNNLMKLGPLAPQTMFIQGWYQPTLPLGISRFSEFVSFPVIMQIIDNLAQKRIRQILNPNKSNISLTILAKIL